MISMVSITSPGQAISAYPPEEMNSAGEVSDVRAHTIESHGNEVAVGRICNIVTRSGRRIRTQVIGHRAPHTRSMALDPIEGICLGDPIFAAPEPVEFACTPNLLGRVLNAMGEPIDGGPAVEPYPANWISASDAEERVAEKGQIKSGIREIDEVCPWSKGERLAIICENLPGLNNVFGSLAHSSSAQINVVTLLGSDSRAVCEFLEHDFGPKALARSVVIVGNGFCPAVLRLRAINLAMTIARYFRGMGKDVLLMIDSVNALVAAEEEIAIASGAQIGAACNSALQALFSTLGAFVIGSVTGAFTLQTDRAAGQPSLPLDPFDGHVLVTRGLNGGGTCPSIQGMARGKRVSEAGPDRAIRERMARCRDWEDLVNLEKGITESAENMSVESMVETISP